MPGNEKGKGSYHHGDLRAALVDVALRLVEAGGEESFSLREAARELGVSANAAYRHFADKASLLAAVSAQGFGLLSARMLPTSALESPQGADAASERFKAVGRAYVEFALERPRLFRLMFGAAGRGNAEAPRPKPTPYDLLTNALDAMVEAGALPRSRRVGAELKAWAVVHGFATLAVDGVGALRPGPERAAALEEVLDFAVHGICRC